MTDKKETPRNPEQPNGGENADDPEIRGRYVEGSYGAAGTKGGRHAHDEEGQYTEGNYGEGGSEGGVAEPGAPGEEEAGRFVEADYGAAGKTTGRTPEAEIGQYPEGDYGKDGRVEPQRKAGHGDHGTDEDETGAS